MQSFTHKILSRSALGKFLSLATPCSRSFLAPLTRQGRKVTLGFPALRTFLRNLGLAGLPLVTIGCTHPDRWAYEYGPPLHPWAYMYQSGSGHCPPGKRPKPPPLIPAGAHIPESAPVGAAVVPAHELPAPAPVVDRKPLPLTLDAVFRLAEMHNPKIAVAREKLTGQVLESELVANAWIPKIYASVAYYRHEGGIQNEDGKLTHSSTGALFPGVQLQGKFDIREATFQRIQSDRQLWQQKTEIHKITHEMLMEAALTYVDLLAARRGVQLAHQLGEHEQHLKKRAEELSKAEPAASVLAESLAALEKGRAEAVAELMGQADAASAKLAYLLGLPPTTCFVPINSAYRAISLVDVSFPKEEFINRAITHGPGVQELQGLLSVLFSGIAEAEKGKYYPTVQVNAFEGPFAAGPGGSMDLDNRLDLGVQLRWDLTQLHSAKKQKQIAENKIHQVNLTLKDLHGKLAAGVVASYQAILTGRARIANASEQIQRATNAYRKSDLRLRENVPGSSMSEVLQTIQALEKAHSSYVQAVRAHNKAQIRLLLLLGPGVCPLVQQPPTPAPQVVPVPSDEEPTPKKEPPKETTPKETIPKPTPKKEKPKRSSSEKLDLPRPFKPK